MATITTGTVGTGVLLSTGVGNILVPATASVALVGAVETAYGLAVSVNSMNQMEDDWGRYEARKNEYFGNDRQVNGTPKNNQAQNKQVDCVVNKYELNKDQRRMLHEEITGQNYSYKEMEQIAKDIKGIEE